MNIPTTHTFLFTLKEEKRVKGHKVLFLNRDNIEESIELSDIEISASPLSCKLIDTEGRKYLVPFVHIKEVYLGEQLVWDAKKENDSNMKRIKW